MKLLAKDQVIGEVDLDDVNTDHIEIGMCSLMGSFTPKPAYEQYRHIFDILTVYMQSDDSDDSDKEKYEAAIKEIDELNLKMNSIKDPTVFESVSVVLIDDDRIEWFPM